MLDMADKSFMWNSFMTEGLINFRKRLRDSERKALDKCQFLTTVIRGFALTREVRVGQQRDVKLTIISRQSWKRAGTRYNARGVDDEGNVANFVETETILDMGTLLFGYTQIRGSVPIFWEQDLNLLSAKINITRSAEATQPSFARHFESLVQKFGAVHVVNLLANKPGEAELARRYRQHIYYTKRQLGNELELIDFDFHAEVANGGYASAARILPKLRNAAADIGFYSHDTTNPRNRTEQKGIFRTNCLDCLDRTNMIQQLISREALWKFFEENNIDVDPEIWSRHNIIWADNGDQLSQIYAGTNALKTSYTRTGKMNLAGALSDVTKSLGRMYMNNFTDGKKQTTIELLLGRAEGQQQVKLHDPINDYVTVELNKKKGEFSSTREIKIFAGTFNLNGKLSTHDLSNWLFPPSGGENNPDVVLVGFQEIVELTPSQILNAESGKREFWEKQVALCLNKHDSYVLVRSDQLVGTALMMFVKNSEIDNVKGVEGATKKTGLGGMAGNKGGIAVSFSFANTSFCFITAHLAAGTNNVDERHHDFKTISSGLIFSRGRRVKSHDSVIWLGDFNYRVDLPYEVVKDEVLKGNLEGLFEKDQLNLQMVKGETFPYYNEMQITFPPTYKFDNDSDEYDTSEKMRTPSWTDRILSRGPNLHQTSYGSDSSLKFSDHRPVYATFQASILIVDEEAKAKLSKRLYDQRKAEVGDANDLVTLVDINETTLTNGLAPPSSDTHKYWIEGGQSTKVVIKPPGPNMYFNPARKSNPFVPDVDFVSGPPLPPRPATFTALTPLKPETKSKTSNSSIPTSTTITRRTTSPISTGTASTPVSLAASKTTKTPPPVPKKPENLSVHRKPVSKPPVDLKTESEVRPQLPNRPASSTSTGVGASSPVHEFSEGTLPSLLPVRNSSPSVQKAATLNLSRKGSTGSVASSVLSNSLTPPSLPPRRGTRSLMDEDDGNSSDHSRNWTPPPVPPSRNSIASTQSKGSAKSLLDENDPSEMKAPSGFSGLTVLQPSKN